MNLPHGPVLEKTQCTHCGELCEDGPIIFHEKPFCCEGCKTVFELFTENGLQDYYALNANPGTSPNSRQKDKFAFLENQELTDKLVDYRDENNVRITLEVPSIHCSSCIWLLENLHTLNDGVRHSTVNFSKRELTILLNPDKTSLRQSAELLAMIGYEPVIPLEKLSGKETKPKKDYSRWYKIGVAGFCFGNIMLLTLPEYFDPSLAEDRGYSVFFRIMNIVLALPAVFYVSPEYFRSAWGSIRGKSLNIDVPIALGIAVIFLRSIFEILTDAGPGYLDSLCGLVFFMSIGRAFQQKTYDGLNFERDYKSYFPVSAARIEEDETETYIPVTQLQKGDVIRLRNGELCPADATLMSDTGVFDAAFVTGESKPVEKTGGQKIFAGLKNVGSANILRIEKEVSQSYLTDLWNNKSFQKSESRVQGITDRLSQYFTPAIFIISLGAFGYHGYYGDWATAWNALTAVLIVACPCALALASPFALGNALRILGRNRFYLKNSISAETLAVVNHIVFDKTGTITQNGKEDIQTDTELSPTETDMISSVLKQSNHTLSRNLFKQLDNKGSLSVQAFSEVEGKGIEGTVEGHLIRVGSASWCGAAEQDLFTGQTSVWIAINGLPKTVFRFSNKYRNGLKDTLKHFAKGMRFSILSGDHSGEEARLREIFPADTQFRFKALPEEKPVYIQQLKDKGDIVMMAGDGLNDSGALQCADIGVSVSDNLNTFTPASDAILDGKAFHRLPVFIKFSQYTLWVVKAGFVLSFLYNAVGLYLAVTGNLTPVAAAILMPMSSITVVSFVTGAVNLVAAKMKL